ncbi:MAG: membrane protein insertase YidC [Acidiferrobacterales bacterium]
MDNQRLLLLVVLSVILLLLWQAWEKQHPTNPVATTTVPAAPSVPAAPATPGASPALAPKSEAVASLPAGVRIHVTTDLFKAELDTRGGDLRQLDLKAYPVKVNEPNKPLKLLRDHGGYVFYVQSGLIGHSGQWPDHKTLYQAAATRYTLGPGQNSLQVPLTWVGPQGLRVTKTYTFRRNSYVVDVSYAVTNGGGRARNAYLYAQLLRSYIAPPHHLFGVAPSYVGAAIYSPAKKYQKVPFDDMRNKPLAVTTRGGWVAVLQHYFVGAWIPPSAARTQFYSEALGNHRYVVGYKTLTPTTIAPGTTANLDARLYAGPTDQARLKKVAPGLDLTVDYGWLTFIASPIYWLLDHIHDVVGNWGWSIILLTVLIKLVFYPLSATSYRSMAHLRRVQPKLASLKERYGDDREKLSKAMMEIYKTEKINPLGGCLPIVVQIPVFISLYWVLLQSVELRQAPFILWIHDLSARDPYFILPILMGISMLVQQLISPQMTDPLQRKVMMAMPVLFTFFFAFFPSGLVLYWVCQNLLSIAQQWWITRRFNADQRAK